jgi:hypothetical protein
MLCLGDMRMTSRMLFFFFFFFVTPVALACWVLEAPRAGCGAGVQQMPA